MLIILCMTLMVRLLLFNVLNQFTKTSTVRNYNTTASSNELFYVKASRIERMKNSFARIGVLIWNSVPCSLRFFVNLSFIKISSVLDFLIVFIYIFVYLCIYFIIYFVY